MSRNYNKISAAHAAVPAAHAAVPLAADPAVTLAADPAVSGPPDPPPAVNPTVSSADLSSLEAWLEPLAPHVVESAIQAANAALQVSSRKIQATLISRSGITSQEQGARTSHTYRIDISMVHLHVCPSEHF